MMTEVNLSQGRMYKGIAEKIAEDIGRGTFGDAEKLPAERILVEQYGASRQTIREALIALEVEGYVHFRKAAGVFILKERDQSLVKTLPLQDKPEVGPFELLDARYILESEVAAYAALNITQSEIEHLEYSLEVMREEREGGMVSEDGDRLFHLGVAKAAHNSVMEAVIESMWLYRVESHLWDRAVSYVDVDTSASYESDHRKIIAALKSRNPQQARQAMKKHLSSVRAVMLDALDVHAPIV